MFWLRKTDKNSEKPNLGYVQNYRKRVAVITIVMNLPEYHALNCVPIDIQVIFSTQNTETSTQTNIN
jgi:hypothetical protein